MPLNCSEQKRFVNVMAIVVVAVIAMLIVIGIMA